MNYFRFSFLRWSIPSYFLSKVIVKYPNVFITISSTKDLVWNNISSEFYNNKYNAKQTTSDEKNNAHIVNICKT